MSENDKVNEDLEHSGSGHPLELIARGDTVDSRESRGNERNPTLVSFWDDDLKHIRTVVSATWIRTVFTMAVFIIGVLSLYWGALFGTVKNLPSLTAWIVDFDGQQPPYNTITPFVGPLLRRQFDALQPAAQGNLGWTAMPPARFDYDPMNVRRGIYDEHAYLAIVVNENATALLEAAVNNGNQSYDPTGAIQVIYNSARDQTTIYSYILPAVLNTLLPITRILGREWAVNLSRNASIQDVWKVPQAINPAVGFTLVDLRPFSPPTAVPSVSIGLIYLIIISFFNYTFLMPVHEMFMKNKHQQLYPTHLLIWRLISSIVVYLFLSLSYSLVSLAFQIPFNNPPAADTESALNPNAFGKASFIVYWMINWAGMAALGLPSENMAMILGQPWSAFWLIFWVITNVSTGFYPIDLAPGFYKWGYAWPLNRIASASRTVIFDTHSNIGLDIGILLIWVTVSIALFPFSSLFMRWKVTRAKR